MISGYFGGGSAAICGANQYDTGQRMTLHGIPSPQELGEADDFLSGDLAAVQVQYGYAGDAQAQIRLAEWDEARGVWMAPIPDEYLTRSETVNVYVHVSYGADENGSRGKTMYTGVFTPAGRPAPDGTVTDEQAGRWASLEVEVNLALDSAAASEDSVRSRAQQVTAVAEAAAAQAKATTKACEAARQAEEALTQAGSRFAGLTVRTVALAAGSAATAEISGSVVTLGLPSGASGAKGEAGDTGPADITLTFSDGVLTITPR